MISTSFKGILFLFMLPLVWACGHQQPLIVSYTDSQIAYSGRIDTTRHGADLYWSGTAIRMNFKGTSIEALFEEELGDNYYNVIIDDSLFVWQPGTTKGYYELASGLSEGAHSIEIFKRTEWDRGRATFYGFQIKGAAEVLGRPAAKIRKMEFYGNSISAGYGVEDFSGQDRSDSVFTNNYLSYATLTARHFDAESRCICKSGIGIVISWFPLIMPEMYDRLDPNDSSSQWDFSKYTPDIVVVNLFQNDSWLVMKPEHEQFKARFGTEAPDEGFIVNAYKEFISKIRGKYPNAQIICALGNMDATREGSSWPGYIQQAVDDLDDSQMYTHFMPFKESPGHPTIAEQEAMAQSLSEFIEANVKW